MIKTMLRAALIAVLTMATAAMCAGAEKKYEVVRFNQGKNFCQIYKQPFFVVLGAGRVGFGNVLGLSLIPTAPGEKIVWRDVDCKREEKGDTTIITLSANFKGMDFTKRIAIRGDEVHETFTATQSGIRTPVTRVSGTIIIYSNDKPCPFDITDVHGRRIEGDLNEKPASAQRSSFPCIWRLQWGDHPVEIEFVKAEKVSISKGWKGLFGGVYINPEGRIGPGETLEYKVRYRLAAPIELSE